MLYNNNNNNNNNNNKYLTAIGLSSGGCGYFTRKQNMKLVTTKFKSGGLHEKHVVATWNLGNHLSICLKTQGNQEKLVSSGSLPANLAETFTAVLFFSILLVTEVTRKLVVIIVALRTVKWTVDNTSR